MLQKRMVDGSTKYGARWEIGRSKSDQLIFSILRRIISISRVRSCFMKGDLE